MPAIICVVFLRTPFKVISIIVPRVFIFMIYNWIVFRIWNKHFRNKTMDIMPRNNTIFPDINKLVPVPIFTSR